MGEGWTGARVGPFLANTKPVLVGLRPWKAEVEKTSVTAGQQRLKSASKELACGASQPGVPTAEALGHLSYVLDPSSSV